MSRPTDGRGDTSMGRKRSKVDGRMLALRHHPGQSLPVVVIPKSGAALNRGSDGGDENRVAGIDPVETPRRGRLLAQR